MELSFQALKQKDVVSVTDGKNLGKVCDVTLTFPESDWLGITVTGCKGFKLTNKKELFIPVRHIVKIGQDAILVKTEDRKDDCKPPKDNCPPPPVCPPPKCPPKRPPKNPCPPDFPFPPDRRDYGEYE